MQLPTNSPNVPPYQRGLNSKRDPSLSPPLTSSLPAPREKFLGVKVTNIEVVENDKI